LALVSCYQVSFFTLPLKCVLGAQLFQFLPASSDEQTYDDSGDDYGDDDDDNDGDGVNNLYYCLRAASTLVWLLNTKPESCEGFIGEAILNCKMSGVQKYLG